MIEKKYIDEHHKKQMQNFCKVRDYFFKGMREQKVWVEKMPRKVAQRVIHFEDGKLNCVELMFDSDIEPRVIEDIHDHDQELVRQVCEKIEKAVGNEVLYFWTPDKEDNYTIFNLDKVLEDIQKEYENE